MIPTLAAMAPAIAPICSWLLWFLGQVRGELYTKTVGTHGMDVDVAVELSVAVACRGWTRKTGVDSTV